MSILRPALGAASAVGLLTASPSAVAQAAGPEAPVDLIIVSGENVFRDPDPGLNPALSYDHRTFQRFEPASAGEALKRAPGVVFTSDVQTFDAVQLRGLGAQFTQVLINGREPPGQSGDGSVFVDRIPADLIERIEIVRAPSADISGEGIAGTLNIILKDGADLDGAFLRVGGSWFDGGDRSGRGSASAAIADTGEAHQFWLALDLRQHRIPKQKVTRFFDADFNFDGRTLTQDDTRNGTDYALNSALTLETGGGELDLSAFAVMSDRKDREITNRFEGPAGLQDLVAVETLREDNDQRTWGLQAVFTRKLGGGAIEAEAGYAAFDDETARFETILDLVDAGFEEDAARLDLKDAEFAASLDYSVPLSGNLDIKTGAGFRRARRAGFQFGEFADVEATVKTVRFAPFTKLTLAASKSLTLEAGVRYERARRAVVSDGGAGANKEGAWLPSFTARWDATDKDRLTASVARTIRYPDFDLVAPFAVPGTPGDDDILEGNPGLNLETALGLDIGYERRLPGRGVAGLNFFYRDISNLIELVAVAPFGDGARYTPLNTGSGKAWGAEFDISAPLGVIGLDETGLYANAAWLRSRTTDINTLIRRKFADQPDFVYNLSLIQNFPRWGAAAGASFGKRGASLASGFNEIIETSYGADADVFLEKRFGARAVIRFTAANLLDAAKREQIALYDGASGQALASAIRNGDIDGLEVEREEASRVFSLTIRLSL